MVRELLKRLDRLISANTHNTISEYLCQRGLHPKIQNQRNVLSVELNLSPRLIIRDFVLRNVNTLMRMRQGNPIEMPILMQMQNELLLEPRCLLHGTSFRFFNSLGIDALNVGRQIGDYFK